MLTVLNRFLGKTYSIFNEGQADEYQKFTGAASESQLLAISSSMGKVAVLEMTKTIKTKYTKAFEGDVNDIHFSPNGDRLAICTSKQLVILYPKNGREKTTIPLPNKEQSFSKVRFITDNTLVTALNVKGRKGVYLALYNVDGQLMRSRAVKKIKTLTCFDAKQKYIVMAGSDLSLVVASTRNLKSLQIIENAHDFAITSIALNEPESLFVSTSVANSIRVTDLPANGVFHKNRETIIWTLISIILTIIIAVLFQLFVKHQLLDSLSRDILRRPSRTEILQNQFT